MKDEALKLALEAAEVGLANLTSYQSAPSKPTIHEYGQACRALAKVREAIADIKAALAQPVQLEQEPVALKETMQKAVVLLKTVTAGLESALAKATPPQRPWVGLTDEDRKAVLLTAYKEWECEELLLCAREDYLLIEQALKEKNT